MSLRIRLDLSSQDDAAIRRLDNLPISTPTPVLCEEGDGATYTLFLAQSVILPKNPTKGKVQGIDIEASQAERIKFDFLKDRIEVTDYLPGLKINQLRPLLKRAIQGARVYNRDKIDEGRKKYTPRIHASSWKVEGSLLLEAVDITYGKATIIHTIYSRLSR